MNTKVKESLDMIMNAFESGDVADAIAYATIQGPDIPCSKWSLSNRLLCYFAGTIDARGIRQWNQAGRRVNKGSKAFYILAPRIKNAEVEKEISNGNGGTYKETVVEKQFIGFMAVPVFRIEDTDGEHIENQLDDISLPTLADVAAKFDVSVKFAPSNSRYAGLYCHSRKEILMCTTDEHVFFHELAHAAHYRVNPDVAPGKGKNFKEIVADLTACAIARLYGLDYTGNSYRYIRQYAGKKSVHSACMAVLSEVEKVLTEILQHVDIDDVAA